MITKSSYRLCLNIKTLNHEDSFQCVNVQWVHSSETLLMYYGWCWGTSAFLIGLDMDSYSYFPTLCAQIFNSAPFSQILFIYVLS